MIVLRAVTSEPALSHDCLDLAGEALSSGSRVTDLGVSEGSQSKVGLAE